MHPTHDKGDIAEAAIILDLTKKGYTIFKPLSQNTFADIVIMREGVLESVQIKYVTPTDDKLIVPLYKKMSTMTTCRVTYRYNETSLHWMAVYCPDPEMCIYVPRDVWANNSVAINLRLTPTKNNQTKNVLYATDYVTI